MPYTRAIFTEFESLQQAALHWNLDFRLLSKNDLSTSVTILTSNEFQLGRVSLHGKIDQYGLCPPGFRSIVVPVPRGSHYNWFNRLTTDHEILIYPRDGTIDAVSYDQFDVYIFSVNEQYLLTYIDKLRFEACFKYFMEHEVRLQSSTLFCHTFHQNANHLLSNRGANVKIGLNERSELEQLLCDLLQHLMSLEGPSKRKVVEGNRDRILKNAVDFLKVHLDENVSIPGLCALLECSERTLQYAFKERFRVSPKDYIKAVKLQKVRTELLNNDNQMISTIAAKYGFWHMGQFAADFRKQFGVLPSAV